MNDELIVVPRAESSEALNLRMVSAINAMKGDFLAIKDIARLAGIGETTIWYRVKKIWKLNPSMKVRGQNGQKLHLFSRVDLMQRLQVNGRGMKY
jgi:hypothetical protein